MQEQFNANEADTPEVCDWLQIGLDGYFFKDLGRWAFRPYEGEIGVRDDPADDLRAIYDGLTPAAQGRWRLAMREALAVHGREGRDSDATRVLIDLVALTGAYEALDVLPTLLASGNASLFHQVLRAAMTLASQTDRARACIENIRTSPSFPPDYAGHVLVALCRADPDGWIRHVENLAPAMEILASRLTDDSTALVRYARGVLDAITLDRVRAGLKQMEEKPAFKWLWRAWFTGPAGLLDYETDGESNHRLLLRDNLAVAVTLDEPLRVLPLFTAVSIPVPQHDAAEGSRTWVAACRNEHLTDLESMDTSASIAWLIELLAAVSKDTPYISAINSLPPGLAQASPTAIVLTPYGQLIPYHTPDSDTFISGASLNTMTDRVRYMGPFRERIDDPARRRAAEHPLATIAATCALGLARSSSGCLPKASDSQYPWTSFKPSGHVQTQ